MPSADTSVLWGGLLLLLAQRIHFHFRVPPRVIFFWFGRFGCAVTPLAWCRRKYKGHCYSRYRIIVSQARRNASADRHRSRRSGRE